MVWIVNLAWHRPQGEGTKWLVNTFGIEGAKLIVSLVSMVITLFLIWFFWTRLAKVGRKAGSWFESTRAGMAAQQSRAADVWLPKGHRVPDDIPNHQPPEDSLDFPFFEEEGGPVGDDDDILI